MKTVKKAYWRDGREGTGTWKLFFALLVTPLLVGQGTARLASAAHIDPKSCSEIPSERVTCLPQESHTACGKRALEAGDFSTAERQFSLVLNICERNWGLYLSKLMHLYNVLLNENLYFDQKFGPLQNSGDAAQLEGDIAYLLETQPLYRDLRDLLHTIQSNQCTFAAEESGPLRIPYNMGPCWGRIAEGFLVGTWDAADAYFMYAGLIPLTPPVGIRTPLAFFPCNPLNCSCPMDNPLGLPPAPCDAQQFIETTQSALALFAEAGRAGHIFQWEDTDGSGMLSQGDPYTFNYLDATTDEPVLNTAGASVLPSWTPEPLAPQEGEDFTVCTYCPPGEPCYGAPGCNPQAIGTGGDNCTPSPTDCIDSGSVPLFLSLQNPKARLSPDGAQVLSVEPTQTTVAGETFLVNGQIWIWNSDDFCAVGAQKPFIPGNGCGQCLTCDSFGVKDGQWIPDPTNPSGPPAGILYGSSQDYPSGSGNFGGGIGAELYAMAPDGSQKTRLTTTSPLALHYQYKVSPDGRTVGWTTDWDFNSSIPETSRIVLADLIYDPTGTPRFRLQNFHYPLPGEDASWYEFGDFDPAWPTHRRLTFNSTYLSTSNSDIFIMDLDTNTISRLAPSDPWWEEIPVLEGNGSRYLVWGPGKRTWDQNLWGVPGTTGLAGVWTAGTLFPLGFASEANSGLGANIFWRVGTVGGGTPMVYDQAAFDAGWRTEGSTTESVKSGNRHYLYEKNGRTVRFRYIEFGSTTSQRLPAMSGTSQFRLPQ